MKRVKKYTIQWSLNGVVKEEFNLKCPRPIAVTKWWIKKLKATSHKTGSFSYTEVL